jgi:putative chitinase
VILTSLGVPMAVAQKWEPEFADQISPETFGDDAGLAAFLGQVLHESSGLQRLVEDLSYGTADRLMAIWPRRFPNVESTAGLVRNPRALAERVYGGRLGNEAPGDGWAYRGRGLLQITGKTNYEAMQVATGEPLVDFPDLLASPRAALKSAILWLKNNTSGTMSSLTVEELTQIINGGQVGIEERRRLTAAAQRALKENPWR